MMWLSLRTRENSECFKTKWRAVVPEPKWIDCLRTSDMSVVSVLPQSQDKKVLRVSQDRTRTIVPGLKWIDCLKTSDMSVVSVLAQSQDKKVLKVSQDWMRAIVSGLEEKDCPKTSYRSPVSGQTNDNASQDLTSYTVPRLECAGTAWGDSAQDKNERLILRLSNKTQL